MGKFFSNLRKVVVITICLVTSAMVFAQTTNVYVGGVDNAQATLWENGTPQYLSENGGIFSVIVIDEDVYAAGREGVEVVKIWKNGEVLYTLEDEIAYVDVQPTSMAVIADDVTGTDIYVTTSGLSSSWQFVSRLWKNGVIQSGYDNASEITSMFIDGSDIYVAGNTTGDYNGIIWKNGQPLYTYQSNYIGLFSSVFVANGDVYYMGGDYGMYGKDMNRVMTNACLPNADNANISVKNINNKDDIGIKIWKNDEILYMLAPEVYAGKLCFSEGILYAVGQSPNSSGIYQAKIWIDGEGSVLEETWSGAESIFVLNGDIYVSGFYGNGDNIAALWKNGEVTALSNTPSFGNDASSVFVVEKGAGIHKIDNLGLEIFPNPVKDMLQIEKNESKINKIEIVDLLGRVIFQPNYVKNQINVSGLPQGIYFVKFETDKGTITRKFVKE